MKQQRVTVRPHTLVAEASTLLTEGRESWPSCAQRDP